LCAAGPQPPISNKRRTLMPSPFDSIRIGSLELPNRIAMAPVKTAYGTTDGRVTDRTVAYFRRRAEGGVGLIVSEPLYVDRRGAEHPKQLGADADDKVEGLSRLAEAIHAAGAKVFAHLNHGGRAANPAASGGPPEAPSKVVCARTGIEPEELTEERIVEIVGRFAEAAARARRAGFDGVELQFGLGYLVAQFLSPATNLRTDRYGGDPERRMRFAEELFSGVREAVGPDFPIGVRISASEKSPGGLDVKDAESLARKLEKWGADLIHVATGSSCETPPWYFQHMALPPGVNEELAARIRRGMSVPVMAAGRLGEPERIRRLVETEALDMVALGRPLLADPDLPKKMREGRDDEVVLCGHCLQACLENVRTGAGIGCNVNPLVGHEAEEVKPAPSPGHIVVVGGGPAGMRAALTAHSRGHRVTLFERDRLGGQFNLACVAPGKKPMEGPLRSVIKQVERSGVEIRLGEEATADSVKALAPDAVIVATGASPIVLEIPGLEDPASAADVLEGRREVGQKVLVIGGGMVGVEVAEVLAAGGKQVSVVEILEEIARDMDPLNRKVVLKRLSSLPVELHTKTELTKVEGGRAFVRTDGEERELGTFDSFVMAVGGRPFDPLSAELAEAGLSVRVVGDAQRPAKIHDAVVSGHRAGAEV